MIDSSTGYMTCDDIIILDVSGMCLLVLKFSQFEFLTWSILITLNPDKSRTPLNNTEACKGVLRPKGLRISGLLV